MEQGISEVWLFHLNYCPFFSLFVLCFLSLSLTTFRLASMNNFKKKKRKTAGDAKVHVKLTPDGEFEGVDDRSNWQEHIEKQLPEKVKEKISFPEKVVVRPAGKEMAFNEFLVLFHFLLHFFC